MSTKHDGGPAFPSNEVDVTAGHYEGRYEIVRQHPGLSLRDYFAGQIVASAMSHGFDQKQSAKIAYQIADAMLAERSKTE